MHGLESSQRTAGIRRVLLITLALNIAVSASKIAFGYLTRSVAIIADGYHSMFDAVSNIVGLAGIHISSRAPDEEHPYGHRKYETIFTIFIGVMMLLTCIEIFEKAYVSFKGGGEPVVTATSFALMIGTLAVNIYVSIYERRMGEKLGSEFLVADSKHTTSDIYATLGVIAGLAFVRLGFPEADWIVGVIVGLFVAKAGYSVLREAGDILADKIRIDASLVCDIVCSIDGIETCHKVRTRGTNQSIFIDLHIQVDPGLSVEEAHSLAHKAEDSIRQRVAGVVDVVVHVEPSKKEKPA
jgi:cation diffusion facilitator family transporter